MTIITSYRHWDILARTIRIYIPREFTRIENLMEVSFNAFLSAISKLSVSAIQHSFITRVESNHQMKVLSQRYKPLDLHRGKSNEFYLKMRKIKK